jgi:hypothetical protein
MCAYSEPGRVHVSQVRVCTRARTQPHGQREGGWEGSRSRPEAHPSTCPFAAHCLCCLHAALSLPPPLRPLFTTLQPCHRNDTPRHRPLSHAHGISHTCAFLKHPVNSSFHAPIPTLSTPTAPPQPKLTPSPPTRPRTISSAPASAPGRAACAPSRAKARCAPTSWRTPRPHPTRRTRLSLCLVPVAPEAGAERATMGAGASGIRPRAALGSLLPPPRRCGSSAPRRSSAPSRSAPRRC